MRSILTLALLAFCLTQQAQHVTQISQYNLAGPFAVAKPVAMDSVGITGKKFDEQALLNAVRHDVPANAVWDQPLLPSLKGQSSVGVLSFFVNNTD